MRRVVIDTNVLIRAFLKKTGSDWKVYEQFLHGDIDLYFSQELVDEFLRAVNYPRVRKRITIEHDSIEVFLENIFDVGKLKIPREVALCRDVRDNHAIGLAMRAAGRSGRAYLVTADEDILDLKGRVKDVTIMTAKEFVATSRADSTVI